MIQEATSQSDFLVLRLQVKSMKATAKELLVAKEGVLDAGLLTVSRIAIISSSTRRGDLANRSISLRPKAFLLTANECIGAGSLHC